MKIWGHLRVLEDILTDDICDEAIWDLETNRGHIQHGGMKTHEGIYKDVRTNENIWKHWRMYESFSEVKTYKTYKDKQGCIKAFTKIWEQMMIIRLRTYMRIKDGMGTYYSRINENVWGHLMSFEDMWGHMKTNENIWRHMRINVDI